MSKKDMRESKRIKMPVSRRNLLAATGVAVPGAVAVRMTPSPAKPDLQEPPQKMILVTP